MLLLQRRFMRRIGPMLASFIAGGGVLGCTLAGSGAGAARGRHASWDRLRQGWLQLRGITLETDCDARKEAHRGVLDEVAFFGAAEDEEKTAEVFALYESGEIETSPEDVEAACILAALLLGRAEG